MSNLKKYYSLVKKFKYQMVFGFVIGILTLYTTLLLPKIVGTLTGFVESGTLTLPIIKKYSIIILCVGAFNYIANGLWNYIFFRNYYYVDNEIRLKIFFKALSQSPVFFKKNPISDIINKATSDSANIADVVGYGMMTLMDGILFPCLIFYYMFNISVPLTIVPIITLPIMVYLVTLVSKNYDRRYLSLKKSMDSLHDSALETYTGIKVIKTFNLSSIMGRGFMKKVDKNLDEELRLQKLNTLYMPIVEIISGIGAVVSFVLGARLIKEGKISYGELVTFSMYLMYLSWPAFAISDCIVISKAGKNSLKRVENLIDYGEGKKKSDYDVISSIDSMDFSNVSFSYPMNDSFGLSNINLHLEKGKRYGIVGKTGSGKTSILRMVIREYPDFSGEIKINDVDVKEVNFDALRKKIGYVPQEHFLFSKSIGENIKFFRDVNEEAVINAIRLSDFEKDLKDLPEGLETLSGELGVSLSGGQKQRVSLSRAVLTDVDLLVLDDVLSAVDNSTERNILNNLNSVLGDKIVVMSSHKISAIKDFDEILVVDNGKIVEQGDFNSLVKNRKWFYEQALSQGVLYGEY